LTSIFDDLGNRDYANLRSGSDDYVIDANNNRYASIAGNALEYDAVGFADRGFCPVGGDPGNCATGVCWVCGRPVCGEPGGCGGMNSVQRTAGTDSVQRIAYSV